MKEGRENRDEGDEVGLGISGILHHEYGQIDSAVKYPQAPVKDTSKILARDMRASVMTRLASRVLS
jgi:hypothetical protein